MSPPRDLTGYQNVLVLGGSRNIGYLSALRFLGLGATVTFLLRSTSVFDGNAEVGPYVKSGQAILVKGDALKMEEIQAAWAAASQHGEIDVVLFTVGGTPTFHPTKGMVITPGNLVTQCLLNLLCAIPSGATPRIVTISSSGLTQTSHKSLPLLMKPMYAYFLAQPHKDKLGAERIVAYCTGWEWNSAVDGEPEEEITGSAWKEREGLPAPGTLKNIMVVRPAFLSDGECKAESPKVVEQGKQAYRLSDGEITGYTISRKDVAHFIVKAVTMRWGEYKDKKMSIAY